MSPSFFYRDVIWCQPKIHPDILLDLCHVAMYLVSIPEQPRNETFLFYTNLEKYGHIVNQAFTLYKDDVWNPSLRTLVNEVMTQTESLRSITLFPLNQDPTKQHILVRFHCSNNGLLEYGCLIMSGGKIPLSCSLQTYPRLLLHTVSRDTGAARWWTGKRENLYTRLNSLWQTSVRYCKGPILACFPPPGSSPAFQLPYLK